jgi:NRAMP (natural resistance-associated macrophage protein)-like metal ion transporter
MTLAEQIPTLPPPQTTPSGAPPPLDAAHVHEIRGALGTIRSHEAGERRGVRSRLMALLAIMGPGLIVMVGDNDAGGVSTYAAAGQNYGTTLLWTLLLLIPILIVNQEMAMRVGVVTGVGHARLVKERFGRIWAAFAVTDLLVLNFLTLATEFIGVSLGLSYFGVSKYVAVPVAALALIAITASGSFRRWERGMYVFLLANVLVIPLVVMVHPHLGTVAHDTFSPGIEGGANAAAILLIIAIVGTTITPWQLFFQQSNVADKRITPRWINYERADTVIGAFVVVLSAGALMVITAFALGGTPAHGHFVDAEATARALRHHVSPTAGALFSILLVDASLVGAAAVTLATSYAFGDVFGIRNSLNRSFKEAKGFYLSFATLVVLGAGVVLIPGAPLGLIVTAVQALSGLLVIGATVFLLMLCNDRAILGPWTNPPWLNVIATAIVGVLIALATILTVSTLVPSIDVKQLAAVTGVALGASLAAVAAFVLVGRRMRRPETAPAYEAAEKRTWTMPPLALLEPATLSSTRKIGLAALRGYLLIAAILLVVKTVQLGS